MTGNQAKFHEIPKNVLIGEAPCGTTGDTVTAGNKIIGAQRTPTGKSQVSYRPRHYRKREIRRAGEQTSPQVARAAGPRPSGQKVAD